MRLSVIIPAYNEANRLPDTLMSVHEYLSKQRYDYEILVVNDGSSDNTADVVHEFEMKVVNLSLIDHKDNHGKGWAVRDGMQVAQGDFRLFMDADNSTKINEVEAFLETAEKGADIVVASRRIAGSKIAVHQGLFRDFLGGVFRFIVHVLVPVGVSDSQAGFKLFSRRSSVALFSRQTIFRWAFDVELLAIARLMKMKIAELPITWKNDSDSKVKFSGMMRMLMELLIIRWNLWTNQYRVKI